MGDGELLEINQVVAYCNYANRTLNGTRARPSALLCCARHHMTRVADSEDELEALGAGLGVSLAGDTVGFCASKCRNARLAISNASNARFSPSSDDGTCALLLHDVQTRRATRRQRGSRACSPERQVVTVGRECIYVM